MDAGVPQDFAGRLGFALKTLNLSPAALGAAVGVDKSVVSRWLSGRTLPSSHNRARICSFIAAQRPGFTALAFDADRAGFLRALRADPGDHARQSPPPPPAAVAAPDPAALILPFDILEDSRHEVARRGVEYFGHYHLYYWSFSQPGRIVRMAFMLRPAAGLIEARYGGHGFAFRGWALLLLNRLYIQFAEQRYEAMAFMVTNAGQQPVTRLMTALLVGPSAGQLVPTAAPAILLRQGDITGDTATDDAAFEDACDADPFAAGAAIPQELSEMLRRMAQASVTPEGGMALVQVPHPDDAPR